MKIFNFISYTRLKLKKIKLRLWPKLWQVWIKYKFLCLAFVICMKCVPFGSNHDLQNKETSKTIKFSPKIEYLQYKCKIKSVTKKVRGINRTFIYMSSYQFWRLCPILNFGDLNINLFFFLCISKTKLWQRRIWLLFHVDRNNRTIVFVMFTKHLSSLFLQ